MIGYKQVVKIKDFGKSNKPKLVFSRLADSGGLDQKFYNNHVPVTVGTKDLTMLLRKEGKIHVTDRSVFKAVILGIPIDTS